MTKEQIGELVGEFTWDFGNEFFIETRKGNFIWSDPEYINGTGLLKFTKKQYGDWIKESGLQFGRSKGTHSIKSYCNDFTLDGIELLLEELKGE